LSDTVVVRGGHSTPGAWTIASAALIGFILALVAHFTPHGAIAYSWGALIVVISTGLMLIAGFLLATTVLPRWLVILFEVLIILDILATGVCAYFLETPAILVFMVIALIGWIVHLAADTPRISESQ
jgi:hypothetical protein